MNNDGFQPDFNDDDDGERAYSRFNEEQVLAMGPLPPLQVPPQQAPSSLQPPPPLNKHTRFNDDSLAAHTHFSHNNSQTQSLQDITTSSSQSQSQSDSQNYNPHKRIKLNDSANNFSTSGPTTALNKKDRATARINALTDDPLFKRVKKPKFKDQACCGTEQKGEDGVYNHTPCSRDIGPHNKNIHPDNVSEMLKGGRTIHADDMCLRCCQRQTTYKLCPCPRCKKIWGTKCMGFENNIDCVLVLDNNGSRIRRSRKTLESKRGDVHFNGICKACSDTWYGGCLCFICVGTIIE